MRLFKKLRMRLQMLQRGREAGRLDAELEFHLEQQIAENRAAGMSPEEARQAALRVFGDPVVLRETAARESGAGTGSKLLLRDIRVAARTLLRFPRIGFHRDPGHGAGRQPQYFALSACVRSEYCSAHLLPDAQAASSKSLSGAVGPQFAGQPGCRRLLFVAESTWVFSRWSDLRKRWHCACA